jgi:hypothetical protein
MIKPIKNNPADYTALNAYKGTWTNLCGRAGTYFMKLIELNKTKPNSHADAPKFAMVDDEDYDKLSQYNWCAIKGGHTFYATTTIRQPDGRRMMTQMHRIIMQLTDKKIFVDHKDGNGINNQKSNLRAVTQAQNMCNRLSNKIATSKYVGVSWHQYKRKRKDGSYHYYGYWTAVIGSNGKDFRLGLFKDEIEAAKAYDAKAKELHGEFARLNFPEKA